MKYSKMKNSNLSEEDRRVVAEALYEAEFPYEISTIWGKVIGGYGYDEVAEDFVYPLHVNPYTGKVQ